MVTLGQFEPLHLQLELLHHANPGKVYGATWSKVCVVASILVSITVPLKRILQGICAWHPNRHVFDKAQIGGVEGPLSNLLP